ncbi:MAG TPA: phage holin family protein [Anaerolineaceae bacterium]|nr:phage holin family protein [Anaerolineaceae bacterium]NMC17382.1 phage holin family protein [Chloroflexota bacterium]HNS07792.1 phage holin family protein [Anaerolineaceae bacterium]HNW15031.1 phage holin family protein [Anaerolineaceae bacterium]HOE02269.1 phage holin family protein [Anaerolineaceae bacterium]
MKRLLLKVLINAGALFLAVWLLRPHIVMQNDAWYAYIVLGAIFGLVNALIKPVVMFVSCPLVVLSLGLATLLVNTLMFLFAGWFGTVLNIGFTIPQQQFYYAFLGALIVSVVSFILSRILDSSQ